MEPTNLFNKDIQTQLHYLRASCLERRIPLISPATEQYLIQHCLTHRPRQVVEFGSAVGYSSCVLQSCLAQRGGSLISIESSYPHYCEAVDRVRSLSHPEQQGLTRIYHGTVLDMPRSRLLRGPVELVFVDARKSEYGAYLEMIDGWKQQGWCARNICIILDDVIKFKSKMESLYEYLQKKQMIFQIHQLDEDDGIMVIGG